MKFKDFEEILSHSRMKRYVDACDGDTRKAMTLYRLNLHLSQDMFTVISCFEVALRNAIDKKLSSNLGADWLRDSQQNGGIFDNVQCQRTRNIIRYAYNKRNYLGTYTNDGLLSDMDFGVWKYMFAPNEYRATGRVLLRIFPNKPRSSAAMQYNNSYMFNELDGVNKIRNRMAHHEPICFMLGLPEIDTSYVLNQYLRIQNLFSWMGVDARGLLYGLDHVLTVCNEINKLKK
ncbi:MAG: Abi family protein [Bacteroidales bacterium]|nr:Abi family protein [Bacteroidales bacterium]